MKGWSVKAVVSYYMQYKTFHMHEKLVYQISRYK